MFIYRKSIQHYQHHHHSTMLPQQQQQETGLKMMHLKPCFCFLFSAMTMLKDGGTLLDMSFSVSSIA
jgi:hypothetical protein